MRANSDLRTQLCDCFAQRFHVRIPSTDADLLDGGVLDSMMLVDLLLHLEREFDITVAMDELDVENFRTVDRIAAYVAKARQNGHR